MRLSYERDGHVEVLDLVLTASPLDVDGVRRTLLLLEDHREIERLQDIIPICMCCRQVRNDASYWQHQATSQR